MRKVIELWGHFVVAKSSESLDSEARSEIESVEFVQSQIMEDLVAPKGKSSDAWSF